MIPFIGETYPHRSLNVSAQRSLNLYPEVIGADKQGKSQYILVGTPGSTVWADLSAVTSSPCRGLHYTSTSVLYAVHYDKVIRVASDGSVVETFTMSSGAGRVSMADNGKYLLIADGQNIWKLEMDTGNFTSITLPFDQPQQVKYLKQRFVSFGKDSNQFYWSNVGPDGPNTWDSLDTASAEGSADYITSMAVSDGELYLFGPRSYQVFSVSGDVDLPFVPVGGSYTNIGLGAVDSVAEIGGSIYWLGSSTAGKNQVFMMRGYNAEIVSNHAISTILNALDRSSGKTSTTSDAIGFAYQDNNHVFYCLTLRQADKTIVFDETTGQWHERSSRDPIYNIEHKWHPTFAVYAYDRVIVGNNTVPNLLELSLDKYTEYDGRAIKRMRVGPTLWDELAPVVHRDFYIDIETGVGLTDDTSQGYNPQIMLRWSDDSGHTWSSERWKPLGKIGEYKTRVKWNKLGRSRSRVYEVTITDPVKVIMLGASATIDKARKR